MICLSALPRDFTSLRLSSFLRSCAYAVVGAISTLLGISAEDYYDLLKLYNIFALIRFG